MVLGDTIAAFASAFTDDSPVAAIVARDGRVLFSSRGGAHVADVFAAPSAAELDALIARVWDTRRAESVEVTRGTATFQMVARPLLEGTDVVAVTCVAVDVSDRKATEERLLRNEAMLVDTQGVAHLGTWEWDVSQPTAIWSDELYRIYAETPATYTPTYEGYLKKVHPDDRAHVEQATEGAFRDLKPYSHDERIFRPDGSMRYLHTWGQAVTDAHGKLVKLIGVCQDITDRKNAENALVDAQKFEAVGRLAGGVAHDFNNLLAVVIGNVGLLQSKIAQGDPLQKHLEEIATVGRQGARLTQQLLSLSRGQETARELLDLSRVVRDLDPFLRSAVGERVALSSKSSARRAIVSANRSQVEQVLLNLVVNARDAMPDGGTLSVAIGDTRDGNVKRPPELDHGAHYAFLEVTDSGQGIEPTALARIFEPYFTTKERGHGLGLATVKGIAQEAGGAVTVTSVVGRGTTFRIFLPLASPPAADAAPGAKAGAARTISRNVLLVEDQDLVRRTLRALLESLGCKVFEAGGPREALAIVEVKENHIDLLMTDLVMPVMGGAELARRVREMRSGMKVLFVSGWEDSRLYLRRSGEDARVLHKPFTTAELTEALLHAVGEEPDAS